jgi:DNA-binding response OmpR family regulator
MSKEPFNFPKADILVIDDTPENLNLLSAMLTEQGYKVRSVTKGSTGIRGANAVPPDLILLDVNMPEMNGYEVCQHLKGSDRTREIPVIFISALGDVLDKVKAFAVGGVDYITKPFQLEEVLARIENHLRFGNCNNNSKPKMSGCSRKFTTALKQKRSLLKFFALVPIRSRSPPFRKLVLLMSIPVS